MSGGLIDDAMAAVGMLNNSHFRADEDLRAVGIVLFPNGPHIQPELRMGWEADEMEWECPATSCTYGPYNVGPLAAIIELPGFDTAGQLAVWMYGQTFPALRDAITEDGYLAPDPNTGQLTLQLPPPGQALWDDFQQACRDRISSPAKNRVIIEDDVRLYALYPRAKEILSDPSTDPDVLRMFLRPGIDGGLRHAAATNPSCRDEDLVEAHLMYPDMPF